MERGLGTGSFMHDVFGARTHVLMGELAGEEVGEWLSGLIIAREIRNARQWAQRRGYDGARVRLVGDDALVARYVVALAAADVAVERADSRAAAFGLWQIAVEAGLVHLSSDRP
jgi:2-dehydro-3-deoxygalactonokinase